MMSHQFKQESATHSPKNLDTLDIDQYLNLDQTLYPSPSTSTSSLKGKSVDTTDYSRTFSNNTLVPRQQQSQQPIYAGPSHQYDSYPQQTGFVAGAYNSAVASASSNDFSFPDMDIGPIDGYFGGGMDTINEEFDFNSLSSHNPSLSTPMDMDMAFDSPVQDMFSSQSSSNFVDPTVIGGQEDESAASTPVQTAATMRVWPGMHQQQAMTKAQQQQKQMQEQQQKMAQARVAAPPPPQKKAASKAPNGSNRPPTDPIVEERISRLLSQMRQQCDTQPKDEGNSPNNNAPQYTRHRKDEEDMDEDERLLASEEGKKLSSKERRQLRNKVSARAFRSRRKEYIGQLEGEIAAKVKEADELRASNEALTAENTRLTDLTRMLLSSPAFSTFLNDLSANGGATVPSNAAPAQPAPVPSNTTPPIQPNTRKDANPHQQVQPTQNENDVQVGMMMMPETNMDYSVFSPTNNGWGANMDFGNFNAQVFSVLELPQGPAVDHIDSEHLSGKTSSFSDAFSFTSSKKDVPVIEEEMPCIATQPPACQETYETFDDDFDESDPAFALYADTPAPAKLTTVDSDCYQVFGSIELEKAFARIDLIDDSESQTEASQDTSVSSATMSRFHRICSSMDMAVSRIEAWTAHL